MTSIPNAVELINQLTNVVSQHPAETALGAVSVAFLATTGGLVWALRKCRTKIVYRTVKDNEIEDDLGDPKLRKKLKDQHEKERTEIAEGIYSLLLDMQLNKRLTMNSRRLWSKCIGFKLSMPELLPQKEEKFIPQHPDKVKARLKNGRADRKAAPLVDKKENPLSSMMN